VPFAPTYRPHNNPLFDYFILKGRLKHCDGVFDRRDIRGVVRYLRQGGTLWYAPDQDYGPEHAVFAPFFGQQAATITATTRFAEFNKSPTLMVRHHRDNDNRHYTVEFFPALENFPSGDKITDATRINAEIEKAIRMAPAQYLWMHKRFKTQQGGKKQSPYIFVRNKPVRITGQQYEEMTEEAIPQSSVEEYSLIIKDDLVLKIFPGRMKKYFSKKHPAHLFDSISKHLRAAGFSAPTVNNIFLVSNQDDTRVTFFSKAGTPLPALDYAILPLEKISKILDALHSKGFAVNTIESLSLSDNDDIFINGRMAVSTYPTSLCHHDRIHYLLQHARELALGKEGEDKLIVDYTRTSGLGLNREFMQILEKSLESRENP
jgi:hypothetical protein